MKKIGVLITSMLLSSCATMFNQEDQKVTFINAPHRGETQVSTPKGLVTLYDGQPKYLVMKRSRKNLPITVTCPDRSVVSGDVVTEFDYLVGGVVNILNLPVGWIVDAFSDKAFIYNNVDISRYCDGQGKRLKPGALNAIGVD
jgi:hypothetical protein